MVASLNRVWGCCFQVFKQMKWVCWTYGIVEGCVVSDHSDGDPPSVLHVWITLEWLCLQSSAKTSCCIKPLSSRTSDCCVQSYTKLGSPSSLQSERAATAQGQGGCEKPWACVMTSWQDRWCVCFGVGCMGERGLICVLCHNQSNTVLAAANRNYLFASTYFVKGALQLIFFNGWISCVFTSP